MGSAFEEGCKRRDGTETNEQRLEGRGEKEVVECCSYSETLH